MEAKDFSDMWHISWTQEITIFKFYMNRNIVIGE